MSYSVLKTLRSSYSIWFSGSRGAKRPTDYEVIQPGLAKPGNLHNVLERFKDAAAPDYGSEAANKEQFATIYTPEEIRGIRSSCAVVKWVLDEISGMIKPGLSTEELDNHATELIRSRGGYPSPLNFEGFPKSVSTSVNNVAVHGIPDDRRLKSGDLLSVDVAVYKDGFHGDSTRTFLVSDSISESHSGGYLSSVATECLFAGIGACGPGVPFRKIGLAIYQLANRRNVSVIPILCGHGIGRRFHAAPDIYHTLNNYPGVMRPGMVFTVEPCISEGGNQVDFHPDGFTVMTSDSSRTAQFEHTVLITENGVEILTL